MDTSSSSSRSDSSSSNISCCANAPKSPAQNPHPSPHVHRLLELSLASKSSSTDAAELSGSSGKKAVSTSFVAVPPSLRVDQTSQLASPKARHAAVSAMQRSDVELFFADDGDDDDDDDDDDTGDAIHFQTTGAQMAVPLADDSDFDVPIPNISVDDSSCISEVAEPHRIIVSAVTPPPPKTAPFDRSGSAPTHHLAPPSAIRVPAVSPCWFDTPRVEGPLGDGTFLFGRRDDEPGSGDTSDLDDLWAPARPPAQAASSKRPSILSQSSSTPRVSFSNSLVSNTSLQAPSLTGRHRFSNSSSSSGGGSLSQSTNTRNDEDDDDGDQICDDEGSTVHISNRQHSVDINNSGSSIVVTERMKHHHVPKPPPLGVLVLPLAPPAVSVPTPSLHADAAREEGTGGFVSRRFSLDD